MVWGSMEKDVRVFRLSIRVETDKVRTRKHLIEPLLPFQVKHFELISSRGSKNRTRAVWTLNGVSKEVSSSNIGKLIQMLCDRGGIPISENEMIPMKRAAPRPDVFIRNSQVKIIKKIGEGGC